MKSDIKSWASSEIGRRLVVAIVLFSSFIAILTTVIQLYLDYQQDVSQIHGNLTVVQTSHMDSVINSLWSYDEALIRIQLEELSRLPYIEFVQIHADHEFSWSAGTRHSRYTIEQQFPLIHKYRGKTIPIGTLTVVASLDSVYDRIFNRFLVILLGNTLKTFLVSGFILAIFHYLVARHLNRIASSLSHLNIGEPFTPLKLERPSRDVPPDELDQLVNAINSMQNQIAQYIADRNAAEAARTESENKYRTVVETSNDAIFIAQDGVIAFANPRTRALIGYTEEEIQSTPFTEVIHPEDRELVFSRYQQRLAGKEVPSTYSFRILDKAGTELWVQLSVALTQWEGRLATINFLRDITNEKRIENELRQRHKMEAIGTLAGGIAHDFNNILAAIIGYIELSLLDLPDEGPIPANLAQALAGCGRAKNLIQQILAFSRKAPQGKQLLDLAPILAETIKFLKATLPATIEMRTHIPAGLGVVSTDATQIHQVLMNLCTNARQAMENQTGTLSVTISRVDIAPHEKIRPSGPAGPCLKLTVSDTGRGMDRETVEHIFEPYFTTKGRSGGSGMGLAVVHGIIERHGGAITVSSAPGEGSTFTIYLPLLDAPPSVTPPEADSPLPQGAETILLVDDERDLVIIGERKLKFLGYSVVGFTDGQQALDFIQDSNNQYDLLVTDQTMPKVTGLELTAHSRRTRPGTPVIICTGFSENLNPERAAMLGVSRVLMKPLALEDLATTIRAVLEAATRIPS